MRIRTVAGVLLLLAHVAGVAAQNVRVLKPVDEAAQNPNFLAFRTRLKDIVAKHDTKALLDVLHPDIRASFGSDSGIPAFVAMWTPNEPDSMLWKELGTVLELGGTFDGPSMFTAPYTFSRWPNDVDSFEFMAVTGTNVRIRTEPRANAAVLATVSYAILENDLDAKEVDGWTAVKFDGKRGYVSSQFIRSPIDYRARFEYENGRWRMVFFLAGD
jgi:uncharacterized protein YgiM (DUF1202 family)